VLRRVRFLKTDVLPCRKTGCPHRRNNRR
jgi:hypothetical protein